MSTREHHIPREAHSPHAHIKLHTYIILNSSSTVRVSSVENSTVNEVLHRGAHHVVLWHRVQAASHVLGILI